jgi:hypothetical protein
MRAAFLADCCQPFHAITLLAEQLVHRWWLSVRWVERSVALRLTLPELLLVRADEVIE